MRYLRVRPHSRSSTHRRDYTAVSKRLRSKIAATVVRFKGRRYRRKSFIRKAYRHVARHLDGEKIRGSDISGYIRRYKISSTGPSALRQRTQYSKIKRRHQRKYHANVLRR